MPSKLDNFLSEFESPPEQIGDATYLPNEGRMLKSFTALEPEEKGNLLDDFILQRKKAPPIVNKLWSDMGNKEAVSNMLDEGIRAGQIEDIPVDLSPIDASLEIQKAAGIKPDDNKVAQFVNEFLDIASIYMPQIRIRKIPVIGEALEKGSLDFIELLARTMNVAHDINPELPSAEPFLKQLKKVQAPHEAKLQQYGPLRKTITEGMAATTTSVLAGVPGAMVGGWYGYAANAGIMFGAAEFDRFLEEAEAAGLKREDVMTDAVKSALIESGIEVAQDLAALRVLRLMGPLKPAAKALLKQSLARMGVVAVTEIGGEAITAAAQAKIRQKRGIPTPTPKEAAKQVIGPTAVMVAILGPLGIKAGSVRAQMSNTRVKDEEKGDWRTTTDSKPGVVGNNYIVTTNKAVYEGKQNIEELKNIFNIADNEILQADTFHKPGTSVTIGEGIPSVIGGIGTIAGTKIEYQGKAMGRQHFKALSGEAIGGNFSTESLKPSEVKLQLQKLAQRFKTKEIRPVDTRVVQLLPEKVQVRERLRSLSLQDVQAAEPSKAFAAFRRQQQAQGIPRKQIDANIRRFASEYVRSYNDIVAEKINTPDDATLRNLQKNVIALDPELKANKTLRDKYTENIGQPIWNKLTHELPLRLGAKSEFIDKVNRLILPEYGQSEEWKTLRDTTHHEIALRKERVVEAAANLSQLGKAEQVRASQIIEGSITVDSDRWKEAINLIQEHRRLKQQLREVNLLPEDTAFDQLSRKEINAKLVEARKLDQEIKALQTRLRPIQDTKKAADRLASLAVDRLIVAKTGKVIIPKWQAMHRRLLEDVLVKEGFRKKESAQITSWISEGLKTHQGKSGPVAKVSDLLKRSLASTLRKRFKSLQVMQKADVRRALKKQIGAKLAKKVEQRNALLKRVQTHYKMSGKEYLRRASRLIEEEQSFLKKTAQYLKSPKRFRLIRGYNIQRKELGDEYEKKHMIKEAPLRVMKGLSHEIHDAELMNLFVNVSRNKNWALSSAEWERKSTQDKYKGFKQLPKTDKLGPLSGAMVDRFIWDDLNQAVKEYNKAIQGWDKLLRAWKAGKVVYNPATQFRNIMSNFILAWGADLAPWQVDVYSEAASDYWNKGKYYQEAKTTPLFGAEWAGTEIAQFLDDASKIKTGNMLTDSMNMIKRVLAAPGQTYQGIEQYFKLAVFINERKQGTSVTDSYKKAEKWLFNYNKIPPAIRAARRWYAPFITFSYKAMPRMAEMTVTKPWRMAAIWMMMLGVEEMSRRMIGESEEELERERLVLPDYMRKNVLPGAMSHLLLPYKDKFGQTKWWDLSFILPWGDVAEQWGQSRLAGRAFLPNHPLYVTLAEIGFNRVFFTGQELTIKDVDEGTEYWKKIGTQVWRQFLPSLAGSYSYTKFMSALHGEKDWQGRERDLTETVFDVFFGIKIRSIDYTAAYGQRMRSLRGNIMDIRKEFSGKYRKLMLNPPKDPAQLRKKYQELFEASNTKMDRIIEKITEIKK